MIFRKNKPAPGPEKQGSAPRGRGSGGKAGQSGANALARRFLDDDEPDTTDLASPAGFHAATPEPETRAGTPVSGEPATAGKPQLLSHDPESGRFYVHPGTADVPVLLEGQVVTARTELAKGDRIRIGTGEFVFTGPVNTP